MFGRYVDSRAGRRSVIELALGTATLREMRTLEKPQPGLVKAARKGASICAPKTLLGKRLWAMRQKYIAGGGHLLNWDQLEKEIAQHKGQSD